jgi:hypothetical protein
LSQSSTWAPFQPGLAANDQAAPWYYLGVKIDDYGGAILPYGGNDWLALTPEETLEA